MSTIGDFLAELVKKCLIETLKESALHPDRPIEVTKQIIKLTEQELEEVFDKIDASDDEREIWKKAYFKDN